MLKLYYGEVCNQENTLLTILGHDVQQTVFKVCMASYDMRCISDAASHDDGGVTLTIYDRLCD